MAFWDKYPYTDFHELNLDWVIRKIQEATSAAGIFFDDTVNLNADNVQDALVALDNLILQVASQSTKFEQIDNAIPENYWQNGHVYTHLQTVNDPTLTAIIEAVKNGKYIAFKRFSTISGHNIEKLYLELIVEEIPADYVHIIYFKNPLTNDGMSLKINGLNDADNIYVELDPDAVIPNVSKFNGRSGDVVPEAGDYDAEQIDFTDAALSAADVKAAILEVNNKIPANIVEQFNGRDGNVLPTAGDYDANQIDYDNTNSGLAATEVQAAIDEIVGSILSAGVASFNGRTGPVTPQAGDYDASQIDFDPTNTSLSAGANTVQKAIEELAPASITVTLTLNGAKEDNITIYDSNNTQVGSCIFASGQTSGTCQIVVPIGGGSYKFVSNVSSDDGVNDYEKSITLTDDAAQTVNVYPDAYYHGYWYGNNLGGLVKSSDSSANSTATFNTNSVTLTSDSANSAIVLTSPSAVVKPSAGWSGKTFHVVYKNNTATNANFGFGYTGNPLLTSGSVTLPGGDGKVTNTVYSQYEQDDIYPRVRIVNEQNSLDVLALWAQ